MQHQKGNPELAMRKHCVRHRLCWTNVLWNHGEYPRELLAERLKQLLVFGFFLGKRCECVVNTAASMIAFSSDETR